MTVLGMANSRMKDLYDIWMLISARIAETRRKQAAGLGKIETTLARRRTSRCRRSTPLVVRNKRRKDD
jgi:hypothetical protein